MPFLSFAEQEAFGKGILVAEEQQRLIHSQWIMWKHSPVPFKASTICGGCAVGMGVEAVLAGRGVQLTVKDTGDYETLGRTIGLDPGEVVRISNSFENSYNKVNGIAVSEAVKTVNDIRLGV